MNELPKILKKQLIIDITKMLQEELLNRLDEVPENWNGIEIKQWIADFYTKSWIDASKLTGKRKKDYKNDILISSRL